MRTSLGLRAWLSSSSLKACFPQPCTALSGLKQQESGTAVRVGTKTFDGSSFRSKGEIKALTELCNKHDWKTMSKFFILEMIVSHLKHDLSNYNKYPKLEGLIRKRVNIQSFPISVTSPLVATSTAAIFPLQWVPASPDIWVCSVLSEFVLWLKLWYALTNLQKYTIIMLLQMCDIDVRKTYHNICFVKSMSYGFTQHKWHNGRYDCQ